MRRANVYRGIVLAVWTMHLLCAATFATSGPIGYFLIFLLSLIGCIVSYSLLKTASARMLDVQFGIAGAVLLFHSLIWLQRYFYIGETNGVSPFLEVFRLHAILITSMVKRGDIFYVVREIAWDMLPLVIFALSIWQYAGRKK